MKELWFWRVATVTACIGWGVTWWTADVTPEADLATLGSQPEAEQARGHPGAGKGLRMGPQADRGLGRGKADRPGSGGAMRGGAEEPGLEEGAPKVQVSEESLALAREELAKERQQNFLARMEERHGAALDSLDAFSAQHELSEEEVSGVEQAIDLRFEAMGEAFEGEGMEPDARRDHMKAVADAFEMQVVGVLGEDLAALYLEQIQRPSWGRVGNEPD